MADPYVPVHAVTYDMTDDGPKIRGDQVVTAESDSRPPPEPVAHIRAVPRMVERRPDPPLAPPTEKGE